MISAPSATALIVETSEVKSALFRIAPLAPALSPRAMMSELSAEVSRMIFVLGLDFRNWVAD